MRELAASDDFFAMPATSRPDGSVHATVMNAGVLADPEDGVPSIGIVVAGGARKLDHLRRSGGATVVFKNGGSWVAAKGPVRLEGTDDPAPGDSDRPLAVVLREVFRAAGGTHDDWASFDRAMAEDRRCAVFVKVPNILSS